MRQQVQRKVYFFRLADYAEFGPLMEDCVRYIGGLPFDDQGRYLATVSDEIVLALFVTSANYPIKIQFGRIKRTDLPLVENEGEISPLEIAQGAGILDWSHIVIFPDGVVAAEFNRDAPRIARLGEYLSFKSRGLLPSAPRFYPLFQRAVLEELENFQNVTALEIEALTTDADAIAEADRNLGAAFAACRKAGKVRKTRIVLKAVREKDNDLRGLARRLFTIAGAREALTTLKATGKTPFGRKPLDMLEDYLISAEDFVRLDDRSRAIATSHAFAVIERAYDKNRSRLASAAVANEPW
jgi:hypothetical protein